MKKYSKFFAVLLAVAMILPGMGQLAEAAEAPAVFVTVMDLNLRTKPVNNASPVVYVPMNKEVERVSISSDQKWFELKYDGKTGFALRGDVTSKANFESTDKPVIHDIPLKAPMGSDFKTVSNVNLRTGDRNDYRAIELLGRGTTVTRLGTTDNNWFRVKVGADEGYVYRGDVTSLDNFNSGSSDIHTLPLKEEANGNTYQTIIAQNLRTGDRDDYRAIKPLPRLEEVKHLGTTNNDWFLVEAKDGTRGYVYRGDVTLVVAPEVLAVTGVSAINSTQAEVEFNMPVKEVKPANFKVTDKDGNLLFVSKAELNKAKDVATLSFFDAFANKGVYTVETSNVADVDGNVMATSTDQFGYEVAAVDKVVFTTTTVPTTAKGDLNKYIKVTDKLGRDVTEEVEVVFTADSIVGIDGTYNNTTDATTAVVKATVKDTDVATANTVITFRDSNISKLVGYQVDASANLPADTDAFNKLAEDKVYHFLNMGADKQLGIYFEDQYGNEGNLATTDASISFTNVTPNIVIVENDFTVKPISTGVGYVKVTQKSGTKVVFETTLKIEVKAEAKLATMEVDKANVAVAAGSTVAQEVKVSYKDQFGKDYTSLGGTLTAKADIANVVDVTIAGDKKSVDIKGKKAGDVVVTLTYEYNEDGVTKKLTQDVNVSVAKQGTFAGYDVKVDTNEIDAYADSTPSTTDKKVATVSVYKLDENGAIIDEVASSGFTLEVGAKDTVSQALVSVSSPKITAENVADKPGTATVIVKVSGLEIGKINIAVKDSAPRASSVKFTNNAIAGAKVGQNLETKLKEIIEVYNQDGEKITSPSISFNANAYTLTNKDGADIDGSKLITNSNDGRATADVVITQVTANGVDIKLSTPQVVKLSVLNNESKIKSTTLGTLDTTKVKYIPQGTTVAELKAALTASKDATVEILTGAAGTVVAGGTAVTNSMKISVKPEDGSAATEYDIELEVTVSDLTLTSLVTAPVKDATPDTTAIDETQYTGTIEWFAADGQAHTGDFAAETVYVAKVTLEAKEGFTFDGLAADAFSHAGGTDASAANSGVVTITFSATAGL